MKIFISYPPLEGKGTPLLGQNRQFQWFHNPSYIYPMIPASAATLLDKDDFTVIWNDGIAERHSYSQFLKLFKHIKPDIIAIETKTPVIKQHWEILEDLRQLSIDTTLILMGDHVTALPKESLEQCKPLRH